MKKTSLLKLLFSFLIVLLFFVACKTVPITGRKQLNLVSDGQMLSLSTSQYNSFLRNHVTLSANDHRAQMVVRVGKKMEAAVENYLRQHNMGSELSNYRWEFNTVENTEVNAWCMPGGKVVVYTGLIPVAQTETGLAVVMGHEIAHAIARHGNERMSEALMINMGGVALHQALKDKNAATMMLYSSLYNIGSQVGLALPHNRMQETEADKLGLIFMSLAGYNPSESVPFWQRMALQPKKNTPEFLSTHPSNETRIKDLSEMIPVIKTQYYKGY